MLSYEIIKKIKKIHIRASRVVNTIMAGQYRSVFRGTGIEFEEVREYFPGDEVKNIDWKVSARMGKPFIKKYREERELVVMLLIDMSASGRFGTTENVKRETAAEVASIIAFNAIRNNDKVGAILFTDQVEKYIPPKKGSAHVWRVISEMFDFSPRHPKTDIAEAISYLGKVSVKKTICFIISDFLDDEYIKQLKTASKRHDVIPVILSDPGDFVLPEAGLVTLFDLESGRMRTVDASDKKTRREYERIKREEYDRIRKTISSADIDYMEMQTNDDVVDVLFRFFLRRKKRLRVA